MTDTDPSTPAPALEATGTPVDDVGAAAPGTKRVRPKHKKRVTPKSTRAKLIEWVVIVVIAVIVALLVRAFVVQAFYIPSGSMEPTLGINNRVLVDRLAYDFHAIHRGDMVVFRRPPADQADPKVKDLVKRVVGLPGETISSAPDGHVLINGKPISESYLPAVYRTGSGAGPPIVSQKIPPGQYFVMGDHRDDSYDSRFFGTISGSLVVGHVVMKVWPLNEITIY